MADTACVLCGGPTRKLEPWSDSRLCVPCDAIQPIEVAPLEEFQRVCGAVDPDALQAAREQIVAAVNYPKVDYVG